MRFAAVLALSLAACAGPGADHTPRFITIGADAVATVEATAAEHGDPAVLLDRDADIAVMEVDADELDDLSQQMHEQFHRCGGFLVHDSLAEARATLHGAPRAHTAPIDYTLDRAAAVSAVLPTLDATRIIATIRELSAMPNRYYQSASGAAASTWLRDRWRSFTTRRDVTVELFDSGFAQQSVILTIPGTSRADEVVVLGGHLDSIAVGGKSSIAPGADDDASGIATLTEIARALLAHDVHPARTIKIIAYAAEEVGLRGSQAIVRDFQKRGVNVVGALQLDMTNYQGSDKDIWIMKDFASAAQNAFLVQLVERYVGATWGMDTCGYGCSDHASWYRAGVPASMPFESRMRDRNKGIHTGRDTLETSGNNAAHALKFARLGAAYAIELAKAEVRATPMTMAAAPATQPGSSWSIWCWLALALAAVFACFGWRVMRAADETRG